MREEEVRKAIRAHNLSVEEPLRIRLAPGDRSIVCSATGGGASHSRRGRRLVVLSRAPSQN